MEILNTSSFKRVVRRRRLNARAFQNFARSPSQCYTIYWRASVASETLTGVKMKKSGMKDVYWRASVASETVLGVDNAKSGICFMYICMWDGTYAPSTRAQGTFFSKKHGF